MGLDRDLQSIQEVRDLVANAKKAQKELASYSQEQIDRIIYEIAKDCAANAQKLAKMAVEETGFGVWEDKVLKNLLGSTITYDSCKNMKTVGIINEDCDKGIIEVGVPMGIVAALIPSTNPTSTTMYKSIISIKAGNSIVISPHPNAKGCILETVKIIQEAAKRAGAPDNTVQAISLTTIEATNTLLKHRDIGVILATGGEAMVRAAYSSGNPAIGVGPGNGPAYIEKTADIPLAVKRIFDSKTFDNGTICASEQSIVTESCIKDKVVAEVKRQGGYFLNAEETKKLSSFILRANGTMNPKIVGRSAKYIADMAGFSIPEGTRILVSEQTEVSKTNPYSREKLCPILPPDDKGIIEYSTVHSNSTINLCVDNSGGTDDHTFLGQISVRTAFSNPGGVLQILLIKCCQISCLPDIAGTHFIILVLNDCIYRNSIILNQLVSDRKDIKLFYRYGCHAYTVIQ